MKIRIHRSMSVVPQYTPEFVRAALDVEARATEVMGVESDFFYFHDESTKTAEFRVFTDFESMAQYEEVFLGSLLHDGTYLKMAASAVEMITDEPRDEMFVHMAPDDFFMNLGTSERPVYSFEKANLEPVKGRYRREREFCASKGRLRDVMRMQFDFTERFYLETGMVPNYVCTRFSAERIGCSKASYDFDECPVCDPLFMEQDALIQPGMLLSPPIDRLYERVTEQMSFNLAARH